MAHKNSDSQVVTASPAYNTAEQTVPLKRPADPEEQTKLRKRLAESYGKPKYAKCTAGDPTCSALIVVVEGGDCAMDARVRARGEMYNFADVNSNTSDDAIGVRGLGCTCDKEAHYTTDLTLLPIADGVVLDAHVHWGFFGSDDGTPTGPCVERLQEYQKIKPANQKWITYFDEPGNIFDNATVNLAQTAKGRHVYLDSH